jgi:Resolvase, N terminal domain
MTSQTPDDDANRAVRIRRLAASEGTGMGGRVNPAAWAGQPTAIYCRLSQAADDDQTGVDRQERICREVAARLGLNVAARHVFVDNNRSAWKRNRKRKGWDALLEAARNREVGHIVAYHPDRLMRQPRDLEELLSIADDHNITLHGQANRPHPDLPRPSSDTQATGDEGTRDMDNPTVAATIGKPWQHEGEPDRIHYMVTKPDGTKRHLYADRGSPWFKLLNPIIQGTDDATE